MLNESEMMGFVATTNVEKAREFYEIVLGLVFRFEHEHALFFDSNGSTILVQKVEEMTPAQFTVLGWKVKNIEDEIRTLLAKGVVFNEYPCFEQDELGVCTVPGGTKVAWFCDPDGNVLSMTQPA